MACRGVHFALTDSEAKALLACEGDEARIEYVQERIEAPFFDGQPERLAETDKAWDAMHRALTDGSLKCHEALFPATHLVLGGQPLYQGRGYIMSLKSPTEVHAVANFIEGITKGTFRARYDLLDPEDYEGEKDDDDFEYTWQWFTELRDFWTRAHENGHHVLFTVDQ
jgi:hypothetical protein